MQPLLPHICWCINLSCLIPRTPVSATSVTCHQEGIWPSASWLYQLPHLSQSLPSTGWLPLSQGLCTYSHLLWILRTNFSPHHSSQCIPSRKQLCSITTATQPSFLAHPPQGQNDPTSYIQFLSLKGKKLRVLQSDPFK